MMRKTFSFTGEHTAFLLENIPRIIPGIEKVISVSYSPERQKLISRSLQKNNGDYLQGDVNIDSSVAYLTRLLTENAPYSWLKKQDLPFEVKSISKVEMNIFSELTNNILLIRIPNTHDQANDLFFIYFNQDLSNFGLVNSKQVLSTDNKTIIGHILRNSLMAIFSNLIRDKEQFAMLNENTRILLKESELSRIEKADLKEKFLDSMVQLANGFLNDISAEDGVQYRLTDKSIEKIREFNGDIRLIRPVMEKAAQIAQLSMGHPSGDPYPTGDPYIFIDHYHIVFQDIKEKKVPEVLPEPAGEVPVRYSRTMALLDKMENAAMQLKSKNKMLTSANLGSEFPTPVSPPAITDALKKHRSKILHLFREYPNRWDTIRTEFRPVQNILNARSEPGQNSAIA